VYDSAVRGPLEDLLEEHRNAASTGPASARAPVLTVIGFIPARL
jgi:hypothetical protein